MNNRRAAFLLSLALVISSLGLNTVSSSEPVLSVPLGPPAPTEGIVVINGHWNVTNYARFQNATIYLTGNLTVTSTGRLEFVNTSLAMNLTSNGQYRIAVEGIFTMADLDGYHATQLDTSRIFSNNTVSKYVILAKPGSQLTFSNSVVSHCGYNGLNTGLSISGAATMDGMLFSGNYYGITIKANGVTVRNCVFTGSNYGVYSYFCNPILRNITISGSTARGIYLYYSTPTLENCTLQSNKIGIYFQNSEPIASSCNITGSETTGAYFWYSSPLLRDCSLSNALDLDVQLKSFPRLLNTQLNESRIRVALVGGWSHGCVGRE